MEKAAAETSGAVGAIRCWVEQAATGIEVLAVAIIVVTISVSTVIYLSEILRRMADVTTYRDYRHRIARALLLGLALLVAADIIRTVAWSRRCRTCSSSGSWCSSERS